MSKKHENPPSVNPQNLTIDFERVYNSKGKSTDKVSPKSPPPSSPKDNNLENQATKLSKKTTSTKSKNTDKVPYEEGKLKSAHSSGASIPELTSDDLITPGTTPGTTPGALRKSNLVKEKTTTPKGLRKSSNQIKQEEDTENNPGKEEDGHKTKGVKTILKKLQSFSLAGKKSQEDEKHHSSTTEEKQLQLIVTDKGSPKQSNTIYEKQTQTYVINNPGNAIDGFVNNTMGSVDAILFNALNGSFFGPSPSINTYSHSSPTVPTVTEVTGSSSTTSDSEDS